MEGRRVERKMELESNLNQYWIQGPREPEKSQPFANTVVHAEPSLSLKQFLQSHPPSNSLCCFHLTPFFPLLFIFLPIILFLLLTS